MTRQAKNQRVAVARLSSADASASLEGTTSKLAARIEKLETELLDARAQGRRAAEIASVVTALLSNEASRRDPKFQEIV